MATLACSTCRCIQTVQSMPRSGRRYAVAVRASNDKRDVDWDSEWSRFSSRRSQRSTNTYTTTSGSGSSSSSGPGRARVPVDPAAAQTQARIRREESLLLNLWTNPTFQGAGIVAAMLVFLGLLLAAGPMPVDSRCTLPWC